MPDSFSQFKTKIESLVHPSGLAKPLRSQFEQDILQALIYIQKFVKFYASRNRDVFPACSTYFHCGASVVPKPRGHITRLYTLEGDCCPIFYSFKSSFPEFQNWLQYYAPSWTEPSNTGMIELPPPFKYYEDVVAKGCRFNYGFWTIKGEQIFVGHRIESTEKIAIEWYGIRRHYDADTVMPYDNADSDPNDSGTELLNAVASYVRAEDLRKNRRSPQESVLERQNFDFLVAEMIHTYNKETQPALIGDQFGELPKDQPMRISGTSDACREPGCETVTPEEETVVFANIGDYGDGDDDSAAVSEMVKSWSPTYITTNGDNWYGSSLEPSDFELKGMADYRDYMHPYLSLQDPVLTSEAVESNFYICIGNHDRDPVGRLTTELAMCNVPKVLKGGSLQPSTGYYSVVRGMVEHFFYDSGYDSSQVNQQADGNDVGSVQGVWLQLALASSTARWKIVHAHHPGYTSCPTTIEGSGSAGTLVGDGYLSYTAMRNITNKLKLWGADLLLHGHVHAYERMDVAGFPVIINGVGGRNIDTFGTPIPYSQFRYRDDFGACRITASCESLLVEFVSIASDDVLDSLELAKEVAAV